MYNERNILTMSDEDVINDAITIARKFNIDIKNLFISKNNTGLLIVIVNDVSDDIAEELEFTLWRYIAGVTDINGNIIGSLGEDSPSVSVEVYNSENEYKELMNACEGVPSFKKVL